ADGVSREARSHREFRQEADRARPGQRTGPQADGCRGEEGGRGGRRIRHREPRTGRGRTLHGCVGLMSTEILMPALSPTMEEGKLAKWLVKEGDVVKSGTILAEIETDKATMEFEAVDEGKIGQILVAEGTEGVKVNSPIATLLADGEAPGAAPAKKAEAAKTEAPKAETKSEKPA